MNSKNDNIKNDIFVCNSQECFNFSYDFDNLEKLRKQIYEETLKNKQFNRNMFKAKILEFVITFGLCVLVFCAVFYFLMQAYLFSK